MPESSKLYQAVRALVLRTIAEAQQQTQSPDPESGVVTSVNSDGTVNVQTTTALYTNVGTPVILVQGQQVVVIAADGVRVATPR